MYTLALCPHDSEDEEELIRWKTLADKISKKLHIPIELKTFENYIEEKIKLAEVDYDLYYANPVTSYYLYKKGYKPVARLKGKKDTFVVIGYRKIHNHHTTVTTTFVETHMLPLLLEKDFDFISTKVLFVPTQKDIYEYVKTRKAEYGIMYEDSYNVQAISDLDKPSVIDHISSSLCHTLMVKPANYEKIKEVLQTCEEFKLIDEKIFFDGITEKLPIFAFLKTKELLDISKALYNNPYIGAVVYTDKILYTNEALQQMIGYSFKELESMSPMDIIVDEQKEIFEEVLKERMKGKFFPRGYEELKLRTNEGKIIYTHAFSNTILYKNKNTYAGLIFFVDITKEVLFQKLYKALRDVNRAITTVLTEEELARTVCRTLVKELDISFVWLGVVNEKTGTIKSIYKCGEGNGYLDKINIRIGKEVLKAKGLTRNAYRKRKIVINSSTKNNPDKNVVKKEMLKRGFLSSAAIPIMKDNKVHAILNIYATLPRYFDEINKILLEELQHDLSFAIEKIEFIRQSIILEKAVEKGSEWVIIADEKGRIEYINDYVTETSGYSKEDLIGKNMFLLFQQDDVKNNNKFW
ncbi:PAS domain S-box protein [Nitratiruptor sp. SB155-2]|uniref:PAS domain S-box protein n=1 Tax=Nitratiruptor sp. (strain SB155-2) TaxID=387092 RepID=UPI0001587248|nr:PAS domain S-box protein [Nitratiruptor sp. SB155-2]BAF69797.1 conserved hypothetical protein [Nitratiruptor sp. SB155-2]